MGRTPESRFGSNKQVVTVVAPHGESGEEKHV